MARSSQVLWSHTRVMMCGSGSPASAWRSTKWHCNHGIQTLVGVGVSVNVAITNLTFDAVNSSYQVVLPRDAVAGTPSEYVDMVFQHTLRNVATVVTTDDVVKVWAS